MTSNDGFSVVAPMKVSVPSSTYGRKVSCCALLKRCTSSRNSTRAPAAFGAHGARAFDGFADVLDAGHDRRELHELRVGAARDQPCQRGLAGARRPPEDQRMQLAASRAPGAAACPAPSTCSWPTNSSSVRGRMRSASGRKRIVGRRVAQQVGLRPGRLRPRSHCAARRCPNNQAASSGQRDRPRRASSSPSSGADGIGDHVARIAVAAPVHVVLRELDGDAEHQQEHEDLPPARAAARGRRNTAPARRGRPGG